MGTLVGVELGSRVGSEGAVGCPRVGTTGVLTICSVDVLIGLAVVHATMNKIIAINGMVRLLMVDILLSLELKMDGCLTVSILTSYPTYMFPISGN
jgi:hypothetical protein